MTPIHPAPIGSPVEMALRWTPLATLAGYSAYALVRSSLTLRAPYRQADRPIDNAVDFTQPTQAVRPGIVSPQEQAPTDVEGAKETIQHASPPAPPER